MELARYQGMTLEDGERVAKLRGGARGDWLSDRPHAGAWGEGVDYVLVPSPGKGSVARRVRSAKEHAGVAALEDRSSDLEVLLLGTPGTIARLIEAGPMWARVRRSRIGLPRSAAQIASASRLKPIQD